MKQYHDLLKKVLEEGTTRTDRTGTGTISIFGYQMRFDLSKGLPIVTTKKVYYKAIIHELIWFLSGDTNIKYLRDNNIHIWDEWAKPDNVVDKLYPYQWRSFNGKTDQIKNVIRDIRNNPDSRRLIVSAWNPTDVENNESSLPACHTLFQFYVNNGKLDCQLYQRSGDIFLGVPFNITSYCIITNMIAHVCNLKPGEFIHTFGDAHIYSNHIEQVHEVLQREPMIDTNGDYYSKLWLNPDIKDIDDFKYEDIIINGYKSYSAISAPVAV